MKKHYGQILDLLIEDSRYTPAKIATMLALQEQEVAKAIAEMQENGTIVKYTAIINSEHLEKQNVEALIEVKVTPQKTMGFDAIAEEIYQFDEVKSVYLMSGGYDITVVVQGETLRDVAMFVSERLSTLDTVVSTATHFILKKYKLDGVIVENKSECKRMKIHP